MHIRPFEYQDEEHVVAMMREHPLQFPTFIIEKYPLRWLTFLDSLEQMNAVNTNSCYYVVIGDDRILGHAGYLFNHEVGLYEIVGVAVNKEHQRLGIGRQLIHTLCDRLKDMGSNKVILYTLGHTDNESTIIFYRNLGFEIINYEYDFFTTDYHRVTFIKKLVR